MSPAMFSSFYGSGWERNGRGTYLVHKPNVTYSSLSLSSLSGKQSLCSTALKLLSFSRWLWHFKLYYNYCRFIVLHPLAKGYKSLLNIYLCVCVKGMHDAFHRTWSLFCLILYSFNKDNKDIFMYSIAIGYRNGERERESKKVVKVVKKWIGKDRLS